MANDFRGNDLQPAITHENIYVRTEQMLASRVADLMRRWRQLDEMEILLGEIMATFLVPDNQKYFSPELLHAIECWQRRYERLKHGA